ncbi:DUF2310 family Zn-ribbon-containing protein [Flammeovirga aprica]|uniref:DUF2310 family Zn-ribbon-containing protein n=1 Tax=Flammeovirga aprica JL-4 TaxID=694437 RepID=A0A7X9RXN1_9BACT|nr:DUF2310 family Zn-ribbon-containing protein [Flammeovirga aprica]NME70636.1 DUF2310 family Zn-ribbon-containing protein [Flammeovirga aprica JL-4]
MHIIKLRITGAKVKGESFIDETSYYLSILFRSKQIINEEWQFEPISNGVQINLFCPEKDSYTSEYSTKYAIRQKQKIKNEFECNFDYKYVGLDPEFGELIIPEVSEFYILKFGRISPLVDGKSFEQIPLYKIPYTSEESENYEDLTCWENKYEHIRGIWLYSYGNDRWSLQQLHNHNSELNIEGTNCCQTIEKLTKIPTYNFLFNYRAWGQKKDKERKCPNCGGDWFIEGSTFNDFYSFKCDNCRLISELSSNK